MTASSNGNGPPDDVDLSLETLLDEEQLLQLEELIGQLVLSVTLWTEPLAATVAEELSDEELADEELESSESVIDLDLYFEDSDLLELYSAMIYPSEQEPYVQGLRQIRSLLSERVHRGMQLVEIAEEEDTGVPIFIFESAPGTETLLIAADAWLLDTWDILPEEEDLE